MLLYNWTRRRPVAIDYPATGRDDDRYVIIPATGRDDDRYVNTPATGRVDGRYMTFLATARDDDRSIPRNNHLTSFPTLSAKWKCSVKCDANNCFAQQLEFHVLIITTTRLFCVAFITSVPNFNRQQTQKCLQVSLIFVLNFLIWKCLLTKYCLLPSLGYLCLRTWNVVLSYLLTNSHNIAPHFSKFPIAFHGFQFFLLSRHVLHAHVFLIYNCSKYL